MMAMEEGGARVVVLVNLRTGEGIPLIEHRGTYWIDKTHPEAQETLEALMRLVVEERFPLVQVGVAGHRPSPASLVERSDIDHDTERNRLRVRLALRSIEPPVTHDGRATPPDAEADQAREAVLSVEHAGLRWARLCDRWRTKHPEAA